jgi:2-polyprenyl-3-methyl-5-hydroxy-6-metoxy-1,4-benzoquinol methylase
MLSFRQSRFGQRARHATFVDLKESNLPEKAFDFVTAMDVFEHLVEPAAGVDALYRCLRPGGTFTVDLLLKRTQNARSTLCAISAQSLSGLPSSASRKSIGTTGSGAIKCFEKI